MSTGTALVLVGGLAAAGGVVWFVTRKRTTTVSTSPTPAASTSSSSGWSLGNILTTAGSAVALGGSIVNLFGSD